MAEISIQNIKDRLEKKKKEEDERLRAEQERYGNWDKLTTRQKYGLFSIDNMRRVQNEYFDRKLKREYPDLVPYRLELFAEFFELMLDDKVSSMTDYLAMISKKEVPEQ